MLLDGLRGRTILLYFSLVFLVGLSVDGQVIYENDPLGGGGLEVGRINDTIHDALSKKEFLDNVVRIASWNLYDDPDNGGIEWEQSKEEICGAIQRITPMAFGLQEVRKDQIEYIKQCVPFYNVVASPANTNPESLYSPIFFRKDMRQFRLVRNGTFWLSKRVLAKLQGSKLEEAQRPRICTWTHMRFATRLTRYPLSRSSQVYRNFMWLRQVIGLPKRHKRKRKRTKWRWRDIIIANTDLDSKDPFVARKQLNFLFDYLYASEIGPRDYPIILMGDLKWEGSEDVLQALKTNGGLINAMEDSRVTYPGSVNKQATNANSYDYIYHKKMTGVLAATVNDKEAPTISYNPVFSAFMF